MNILFRALAHASVTTLFTPVGTQILGAEAGPPEAPVGGGGLGWAGVGERAGRKPSAPAEFWPGSAERPGASARGRRGAGELGWRPEAGANAGVSARAQRPLPGRG